MSSVLATSESSDDSVSVEKYSSSELERRSSEFSNMNTSISTCVTQAQETEVGCIASNFLWARFRGKHGHPFDVLGSMR